MLVDHFGDFKSACPTFGTGKARLAAVLLAVPVDVLTVDSRGCRHQRHRLDGPGILEAHGKGRDAVGFQGINYRFQLAECGGHRQVILCENVLVVKNAFTAAVHRHCPGVPVCVGEGGSGAGLISDVVQKGLIAQLHDVAATGYVHGVRSPLENVGDLAGGKSCFQNRGGIVGDDLLLNGDIGVFAVESVDDLRKGFLRFLLLVEQVDRNFLLGRFGVIASCGRTAGIRLRRDSRGVPGAAGGQHGQYQGCTKQKYQYFFHGVQSPFFQIFVWMNTARPAFVWPLQKSWAAWLIPLDRL